MIQSIVPKLEKYAQTQVVNISSVRTDHFKPIQRWYGYVPQTKLNHIIDQFFAKKWTVAIRSWLNYPNVRLFICEQIDRFLFFSFEFIKSSMIVYACMYKSKLSCF